MHILYMQVVHVTFHTYATAAASAQAYHTRDRTATGRVARQQLQSQLSLQATSQPRLLQLKVPAQTTCRVYPELTDWLSLWCCNVLGN